MLLLFFITPKNNLTGSFSNVTTKAVNIVVNATDAPIADANDAAVTNLQPTERKTKLI